MLRATWATWTHGRRGAVLGASAAVVCLGGVLGTFGSGGGGGDYVAVGAAGGPPQAAGTAVGPTGGVTLVPLDGAGGGTGDTRNSPDTGGSSEAGADPTSGPRPTTGSVAPAPDGTKSVHTSASPPSPTPASPRTTPGTAPRTPAALSVGEPVREAADERWCEKVTLVFRNTGGTAVRSGTVTFGTHVIGALGIDWATVESAVGLPAPIEAGAREEKTWTVCVDAWRVPLGMHVETRDVSVQWK